MSKTELLNIMRLIADMTRSPKTKHYRSTRHLKLILERIHSFASTSVELAEGEN